MPIPILAIMSAIELGQKAFGVLSAFKGNQQLAKADAAFQDATKVIAAVVPLVQQYAAGQDVTEQDVRDSFARVGASFDELDALIAAKKAAHAPH